MLDIRIGWGKFSAMGLRSPHEAEAEESRPGTRNNGGRVMPSFLEITPDKFARNQGAGLLTALAASAVAGLAYGLDLGAHS
jgi:hypothetical protein